MTRAITILAAGLPIRRTVKSVDQKDKRKAECAQVVCQPHRENGQLHQIVAGDDKGDMQGDQGRQRVALGSCRELEHKGILFLQRAWRQGSHGGHHLAGQEGTQPPGLSATERSGCLPFKFTPRRWGSTCCSTVAGNLFQIDLCVSTATAPQRGASWPRPRPPHGGSSLPGWRSASRARRSLRDRTGAAGRWSGQTVFCGSAPAQGAACLRSKSSGISG